MVIALLLAAGESKRTLPIMKQLYPVHGTVLVDLATKKLLATKVDKIRVILGHNWKEVQRAIKENVEMVVNTEYEKEMLSSIKCGLKEKDSYLIFPVDHPLVKVETIDMLIEALEREKNHVIVPVFKGKRGHPVIIPQNMFDELKNFEGRDLNEFIHTKITEEVSVEDEGIVMNFNTIERLQKLDKLL
ncbi:MAG: nucleotidyltransferase family protein [Candidatus Thermoplasmatota archaeon]|nr:nucleotidyltransferase family protein [Candidatus Thermoplasmatota archaeon]